jgi:hypothetical protein
VGLRLCAGSSPKSGHGVARLRYRELQAEDLARVCDPVADPNLGYEFCNGYYSRVTRLFMTPVIRSRQQLTGAQPMLTILDSFRDTLAGEFRWCTTLRG